jgi:hypothetical protein
MPRIPFALCSALLLAASAALAAWSSDPAVNLSVADAPGDQVQPKVAATADGGSYVSWFDNIANGFDVRVQKLDVNGDELLPHNGVLVADRSFSSTQDYGLDVDASGNALLAFRDDRGGGVQITAARVAPDGTLLWGAAGVELTNTTEFVAAPKIAGTGDGGVVVAWTQDTTVRLKKLDPSGNPLWGAGVTLTPAAGSYSVADLHDSGANDVIVSFVHQTGGFPSPRHLAAQKLDATGAFLWGATPVSVFDGGSLQFGNFPPFVPDGTGGAVFSWYDVASPQLQCYAQRVLAGGTEAFPHNGSAASLNATRVRVSPSAAFNSTTSETFLFWEEESASQSQSGVYGQKFDALGDRQWTDEGTVVIPVGADDMTMVRCLTAGPGAFVFWSRSPAFGQDRLHGARLDANGAIDLPPFDIASTPSQKSRLDVGRSTAGFAILAWNDNRADAGDILAQNVNPDGTLGPSSTGIGAADNAGTSRLQMGVPWPNPTVGLVQFKYSSTESAGDLALGIYDAHGRLVRRLAATGGGGQQRLVWDGLDAHGRLTGAGVYFMRFEGPVESQTVSITVVR